MAKRTSLFTVYWRTRMESAERRLAAALELIVHKPTRGTLAEDVLREIIDAFLPGQWASHSGFVVNDEHAPSSQLDIVVYDQLAGTPLYRDANVVVLPTGARPVVVEVKSVLDKQALFDALDNVASVKSMELNPREVVGVVYAFRGFRKPTTLRAHLTARAKALRKKGPFDPEHLPDMICVQEQNVVVVRERTPAFRLAAYTSTDPVVQSLLTQVLDGLRVPSLSSLLPQPKYAAVPLFEIV
jgi:hypothetical protein